MDGLRLTTVPRTIHNTHLHKILDAMLDPSIDMDTEIEMRWNYAYDGSTRWHILRLEPSMARYGFFPHQAQYRLKKKK